MIDTYTITDDFQASNTPIRVLVLDRDYTPRKGISDTLKIDGKEFAYNWNSVKNWLTITATASFKGKTLTIEFN